jgi:hypothetical protein
VNGIATWSVIAFGASKQENVSNFVLSISVDVIMLCVIILKFLVASCVCRRKIVFVFKIVKCSLV